MFVYYQQNLSVTTLRSGLASVMSKRHGTPLKHPVLPKASNLFEFTESHVIVSAHHVVVEVIYQ